MERKDPEMVRVRLSAGPYDSELFCPFCGEQILEPDGEGVGECPHLLYASVGMDTDVEFRPSDLCFVYFEPAPACQEHYFVFRESVWADGAADVDDE